MLFALLLLVSREVVFGRGSSLVSLDRALGVQGKHRLISGTCSRDRTLAGRRDTRRMSSVATRTLGAVDFGIQGPFSSVHEAAVAQRVTIRDCLERCALECPAGSTRMTGVTPSSARNAC